MLPDDAGDPNVDDPNVDGDAPLPEPVLLKGEALPPAVPRLPPPLCPTEPPKTLTRCFSSHVRWSYRNSQSSMFAEPFHSTAPCPVALLPTPTIMPLLPWNCVASVLARPPLELDPEAEPPPAAIPLPPPKVEALPPEALPPGELPPKLRPADGPDPNDPDVAPNPPDPPPMPLDPPGDALPAPPRPVPMPEALPAMEPRLPCAAPSSGSPKKPFTVVFASLR